MRLGSERKKHCQSNICLFCAFLCPNVWHLDLWMYNIQNHYSFDEKRCFWCTIDRKMFKSRLKSKSTPKEEKATSYWELIRNRNLSRLDSLASNNTSYQQRTVTNTNKPNTLLTRTISLLHWVMVFSFRYSMTRLVHVRFVPMYQYMILWHVPWY